MHHRRLLELFPELLNKTVEDKFLKSGSITVSGGGNNSSKPFLLADIFRTQKGLIPQAWVVNDKVEQEHVARACEDWFGVPVFHFHMQENEHLDKNIAHKNRIKTLEVLKILIEREKKIIVAPYITFMQLMPAPEDVRQKTKKLITGEKISIVEVFEFLIAMGYAVAEDAYLEKGQYRGVGNVLTLFPVNSDYPIRVEFDFDMVSSLVLFDQETGNICEEPQLIKIYPLNIPFDKPNFFAFLPDDAIVVDDELEVIDEFYEQWEAIFALRPESVRTITFTSFPEDGQKHANLHYLSVLKYQDLFDFVHDAKEKNTQQWSMVFFTKHKKEVTEILIDRKIQFIEGLQPFDGDTPYVRVVPIEKDRIEPHAFQNTDLKILIVSDREIANLKEEKKSKINQRVYWDFLTGLKKSDLVVHIDHGIARFDGLERRMVDGITREYLKLEYAENDKLFVPIDQADKVNKFIGGGDEPPRLTRLGSAEWQRRIA